MKHFSSTLSIIVSILLLLAGITVLLVFEIREGRLNKQVKSGLELYFSRFYNTTLKIDDLSVNHKGFIINKATVKLPENNSLNIHNLRLKIEFQQFLKKLIVTTKVNVDQLLIMNQKQEEVLNTKLATHHKFSFRTFNDILTVNLNEISGKSLADPKGANLPSGSATCLYKSNLLQKKTSDCQIEFGEQAYARFNNKIRGVETQTAGSIHNIPLMIYQIAVKLIPKNEIIEIMQEYIKSGHIMDGDFFLHLDKDSRKNNTLKPENLRGKFNITNLEYQYDKDFPPIKKGDLTILLSGSSINFSITKAYIGKSTISKCDVNLDWQGVKQSTAFVKAAVQGPALDLISFIPADALQRAKKNDIDLQKITGNATTQVNLEIPLAAGTKNIYDISLIVSNGGLKIFDNNIEFSKAKLSGIIDGQKIALKGEAKINGFDSNLNYKYNIEDQNDYEHLLQIQTKLIGSDKKIGLIKLLSGKALANLEYKSKGDKAGINITADLKNLEFYLDKIAIHKDVAQTASLVLKGEIDDTLKKANFTLSGSNNLKIIGNITGTKTGYNVALPVIRNKETNLKGQVTFAPDIFTADIRGEELDLSDADMMQFLEKERDSTNTKLTVNINKVRLKNNIFLSEFALNIECDKIKCFKGSLDSKIGSKDLTMSLTALEDKEEWLFTSGNAGAVFLGFDMFKDMRAGIMSVKLETKRRQVKKGEDIPIMNGTFKFEKFTLTNQSFLAQLVSYISLPGLLNLITNNKDIRFSKFTGNFNFLNDTLEIYRGEADGQYFDFTMKGKIDTANRQINLKGQVVPSIYGISTLLRKLPILGKILSGGHRKGVVSAPYTVNKKY